MVGTATKRVKIFPYKYKLIGTNNELKNLRTIFNKTNVKNNVIDYTSEFALLLIIDSSEYGYLYGRFMKLRKDSPTIIDIEKGDERKIELDDNEDIAEMSHFLWDVSEGIIFAEYNYNAIRYFAVPLKIYLNKRFEVRENIVIALEDTDTYQRFRKIKKEIKLFKFGVLRSKIRPLEDRFNLSTLRSLKRLSKSYKSVYEVVVRKGPQRDSFLDRNEVFKIVDIFENLRENMKYLIIETADAVYDLVNNVLLHYKIFVRKDGRRIESEQFFKKARETYENNIDEIRRCAEISTSN